MVLLIAVWGLVCSSCAGVTVRTSAASATKSPFWIGVDFKISKDGHIAAPVGKGVSIAPQFQWKNATVVNVSWPKTVKLPPDGDYDGYDKDFTVLFQVVADKPDVPIGLDLFYVMCDDGGCRPIQEEITVNYNATLNESEIQKALLKSSPTDLASFFILVGMAFLGGIILNCMPCVFPVLSIKIFHIIKNATKDIHKQGIAFSIGVISTFLALGWVLFYLKSIGTAVGWGFYMQNPCFVLGVLLIFLLSALYFFGFYTVSGRMLNFLVKTDKLYIQSFFNGVFTSIASGVCVGPFVGVVVGTALIYNDLFLATCIFFSLGLGVAFPFLSVCLVPKMGKFIPKPGRWLEVLKEFMGFTMLFSCVWLLWVLSTQIQMQNIILVVLLTLVLALCAWFFKSFVNSRLCKTIAICGSIFSVWGMYSQVCNSEIVKSSSKIDWIPFSFEQFNNIKKSGRPIFINCTASWCLTCKMNDSLFDKQEIAELFKKYNIQAVRADWTKRDGGILAMLNGFGINSVPFNVYYKANSDEPIILPSILTYDELVKVLKQ